MVGLLARAKPPGVCRQNETRVGFREAIQAAPVERAVGIEIEAGGFDVAEVVVLPDAVPGYANSASLLDRVSSADAALGGVVFVVRDEWLGTAGRPESIYSLLDGAAKQVMDEG